MMTLFMEQEVVKRICIRGLMSCNAASEESSIKQELKTQYKKKFLKAVSKLFRQWENRLGNNLIKMKQNQ